jgi:hypothetical protein
VQWVHCTFDILLSTGIAALGLSGEVLLLNGGMYECWAWGSLIRGVGHLVVAVFGLGYGADVAKKSVNYP